LREPGGQFPVTLIYYDLLNSEVTVAPCAAAPHPAALITIALGRDGSVIMRPPRYGITQQRSDYVVMA
jgi:hypothetical protein